MNYLYYQKTIGKYVYEGPFLLKVETEKELSKSLMVSFIVGCQMLNLIIQILIIVQNYFSLKGK